MNYYWHIKALEIQEVMHFYGRLQIATTIVALILVMKLSKAVFWSLYGYAKNFLCF